MSHRGPFGPIVIGHKVVGQFLNDQSVTFVQVLSEEAEACVACQTDQAVHSWDWQCCRVRSRFLWTLGPEATASRARVVMKSAFWTEDRQLHSPPAIVTPQGRDFCG